LSDLAYVTSEKACTYQRESLTSGEVSEKAACTLSWCQILTSQSVELLRKTLLLNGDHCTAYTGPCANTN